MKYVSNSTGDALAVFSEIFYDKGWKAFINGKEVTHFRVNYILRGLVIPTGDNEIEFKFDLPIYNQASLISTVSSSIIILLFLLFILFKVQSKYRYLISKSYLKYLILFIVLLTALLLENNFHNGMRFNEVKHNENYKKWCKRKY